MGWDDNLFREAIKKKYAIQQQEADTQQAEQIARAPVHQAQAQYYGGANATELDKTRINAAEEARKTLAQAPMWSAEARARTATAKGTETENTFNNDLYDETKRTAHAGLVTKQLEHMANAGIFGSRVNTQITDRNAKTGESNPMLAQYGQSGLTWEDKYTGSGLAMQPNDLTVNELYAENDVLAREQPLTLEAQERMKRNLRIGNKYSSPYSSEFNMW
jgi:hypothetical protein